METADKKRFSLPTTIMPNDARNLLLSLLFANNPPYQDEEDEEEEREVMSMRQTSSSDDKSMASLMDAIVCRCFCGVAAQTYRYRQGGYFLNYFLYPFFLLSIIHL